MKEEYIINLLLFHTAFIVAFAIDFACYNLMSYTHI